MISYLGELAALGAALSFSMNSLCYEVAGKRVGSYTVTHVRLWIAFTVMLLVHFVFTGVIYPTDISIHNLLWLLCSGVIGYALGDLALFKALVLIGARLSMLIMTLVPIFASLIAWIMLGEVLKPIEIAAILLTVGSVGLVISNEKKNGAKSNHISFKGIIFASLGALGQAVGMVFSKTGMSGGVSAVSANSIRVSGGLFAMFLITILSGRLKNEIHNLSDKRGMKFLLIGSLIGPVLGVILALYAVSHAHVGITTTLMALSPIMMLPFAHYGMKEKISKSTIAGTVMAVIGAIILVIM